VNPLLVGGIAFGAALLGAMSGGSTSLITTPAWMALGAPFPTAVAADKLAATLWTASASRSYLRGLPVDRALLAGMSLTGLVGAAIGAVVATSVDERLLRRTAGALILAAILWSLRRARPPASPGPAMGRGLAAALALPLGLYEGLLGSGNAVFTSLLLQRARHWDLIRALGHYYALAAVWCGLAAAIYFARGAFDWGLAIPATVGALIGATVGARLGRLGGSRVVRPLFVAAGVFLSLRLLLGS
jgi:uncharacterized membrane protein YfcA